MVVYKFTMGFLITGLIISFLFCSPSPQVTFKIPALDSTIKPIHILINNLARNYKLYHGQYIETEGRFYSAFEEFAIYPDGFWLLEKPDGFWLTVHRGLKMDYNLLEKMHGKKVIIKGRIDTMHHGHLSSYLATIDKIYFWEQW